MANIKAEWQSFKAPVKAASNWRSMKSFLGEIENDMPDCSVYIIRTVRPFSVFYPKKASPVLYIGEGDVKQRFRTHMKNWIHGLSRDLPQLEIEVRFASIKVRNNKNAYKDVEADLLWKFDEVYGCAPMLNRQYEYHYRNHEYRKDFFNVLNPGSGKGYRWALVPLASNANYDASLKARWEEDE